MRFRAYIAASLDGYVATPDGGVAWLEAFDAESYGYDEFIADIGTIVVGRATFDQVLGFPEWPYPGKDVFVLTSRPVDTPTPRTAVWTGSVEELVAHLRDASSPGGAAPGDASPGEASPGRDVWLLGGPKTIHAFRELGAVDTYEIFVLPVLLGDGIPLFERRFIAESLSLVRHRIFDDGAVELIYEPAQPGGQSGT